MLLGMVGRPGKLGQNEEKNLGDDAKNFFRDMIMKNHRGGGSYFTCDINVCVCVCVCVCVY